MAARYRQPPRSAEQIVDDLERLYGMTEAAPVVRTYFR
jgi:hypothetical protein